MGDEHPDLHPKLKHFNILESFSGLIGDERKSICFLEEIGLVPSRESTPPHCCGCPMVVESSPGSKFGWRWRCSSNRTKNKTSKTCRRGISPGSGTFFDGSFCHIAVKEVLAIIICFVIKMEISSVYKNLTSWRTSRRLPTMSRNTVVDYFRLCREVAEIIASHTESILQDENKTHRIGEMFITERIYNGRRRTNQITMTVLGLHFRESKLGVFYNVNNEFQQDLWTDIEEFVDCSYSQQYATESDQVNDLKRKKIQLKQLISHKETLERRYQYMALYSYRYHCLDRKFCSNGSKIMQFLLDIKKVYPGIEDGELKQGLSLKKIDPSILLTKIEDSSLPVAKRPYLDQEEMIDSNGIELGLGEASSDTDDALRDPLELY